MSAQEKQLFLSQWLIFAVSAMVMAVLVGSALYAEHERVTKREEERLLASSRIIELNIEQNLTSVNQVLGQLAQAMGTQAPNAELNLRLRTLVEAMPSVRTINVHDLTGTIRWSSRQEVLGTNVNFRQRDYFRLPQENPSADTLFISEPFRTITGIFTFTVARMIPGPKGEFAGVVVATFDPSYFEPQLEAARYASDMASSLSHVDGVLLMMQPPPEADIIGKNLAQPGSMFMRHKDSGNPVSVLSGTVLATGENRMLVHREVSLAAIPMNKTLVIAVSRLLDEIHASWRNDAQLAGALLATMLLLLGAGLHFYQRHVRQFLRQQTEVTSALIESEHRFRLLFDNIGDAVMVHPFPLGKFIDVNPTACERLGYGRTELLQLGPTDIDAPETAKDTTAIAAAMRDHGHARFERVHVAKDGRRIPVEIHTRLFDIAGMPHAISIVRDISERKDAERRLRESETRLRALIEAAYQSAILMSVDGKILAMNSVAAARLGQKPEALIGQDIYALLPHKVAESRKRRVAEIVAKGTPDIFEDERNGMRMRHSLMPIIDATGTVTQIAVFAEDITEATLLRHTDDLLHGFDQQVLGGRGLVDILAYACEQLALGFGYDLVWVGRKMADGSVHVLHAAGNAQGYVEAIRDIGVRWDDTPTGHGPAGVAIRTGEAHVFHAADTDFSPWAQTAARFGLRSILSMPLIVRGQVFGALIIYSGDVDAFARSDTVGRLRHVGSRLNVVVEMAEKQQQMQLLRQAIETAGSGIMVTRRDGTIEWTNRALRQMTGYGETELIGRSPRLFKSGQQPAEYYERFWATLARGDIWREEVINKRKDGSLFTVMQVVAPVRDLSGETSHFISVMEDISQRKQAEDRIRHLAEHDALTDLPNRVLMQSRLQRMLAGEKRRGQELLALLYLDIDRFKQINDTHGHDVGDALLCGFADRLHGVVRAEDTVARVGGDEFVILLPGLRDLTDAEAVALKILTVLELPIDCLGLALRVGSSIGIAYAPLHATESTALLKCADQAMYAAKQAGRNTYRIFAAEASPASA